MQVTFVRKEELLPGIWQFYFKPERALDYVPGQYVELRLPHASPDNRGISRTFTLTSLPDEPLISFALKLTEPSSTYKNALSALRPGDRATVTDAMGDVVLPKSPTVPLVFVAGGLGIASFVSIMRWLTKQDEQRNISLFYAVRDPEALLFLEVFEAYPYPVALDIFGPNTRRLSAETVLKRAAPDRLVYLSGSEKFVENLRYELQNDYDIPNHQIVYDFFDGYQDSQV